jgi:geranylgeranyl pyrophosphate synthase/uncharacterized protein with NAD-binding domain and iron-sulfur cluster
MTHVVILGGGVGGLSAAQELAERGFEVSVYEARPLAGGKARSIPASPNPAGGQFVEAIHAHEAGEGRVSWVPGEHGFRFFPGFYKHVVDSMSRIPLRDGGFVADRLVPTSRIAISQYGRPTITFPDRFPSSPPDVATLLADILLIFGPITELEPEEVAFFVARIWQILTSCPERRIAEYERISWWEFIGAETRSDAYKKLLASGITRSLVAAKARTASTKTIGDIFVQLILTIIDPAEGSSDRVLDGPTNLVWIDPWLEYVRELGVQYHECSPVTGILVRGGRIAGAVVDHDGQPEIITGDHYICALPVERVVPLLHDGMLALDPSLANLRELSANVEWMNGLQFYLRRDLPMVEGHMIHIDTSWALTSISQVQFWRPETLDLYGDPDVKGILSIDVSDWMEPGLNGRIAAECSREEVGVEVWNQLKRSLNIDEEVLRDDDLIGWFLDPDIAPDPANPARLKNSEPLLVNLIDTWRLRPDAATTIPNLFLASDYVQTFTDLATMEGANEAARRAVNAIIRSEGSSAEMCRVWPLEEPLVLEPLRRYDLARFEQGLAWDGGLVDLAQLGVDIADPALAQIPVLASAVAPFVPQIEALERQLDEVDKVDPIRVPAPLLDAASTAVTGSPIIAGPTLNTPGGSHTDKVGVAEPESGPPDFASRLKWYRELTVTRLHELIPSGEHSPYLYDLIHEFIDRPSKGLRPGLLLATLSAHGGKVADGLDLAAALELLHNAFLVHDDIEDGSTTRRGQPTLHTTVGVPLAINVGDAMNALALRAARSQAGRLDTSTALRVGAEIDHLLAESLEGQALELGWNRDNRCDLGVSEYLTLVLKKTAWYSFIHPMRIGALLAGDSGNLDRFNRFGFLIGAAFQIQDDVLNLTGDLQRYGKEIGGDLWEGKRTLILVHAFENVGTADRRWLERLFGVPRERRLPRELDMANDLLQSSGSIDWARQVSTELVEAASKEFDVAFWEAGDGADRALVRTLLDFVATRNL